MQGLADIVARAQGEIVDAKDLASLDKVRVEYLGKSGVLTVRLKELGQLPADDRPRQGKLKRLVFDCCLPAKQLRQRKSFCRIQQRLWLVITDPFVDCAAVMA